MVTSGGVSDSASPRADLPTQCHPERSEAKSRGLSWLLLDRSWRESGRAGEERFLDFGCQEAASARNDKGKGRQQADFARNDHG